MKATIITLALAGFMAISNIGTSFSKEKTYKNTVTESNLKTTTTYTGNNDKYLQEKRKTVIKYNESNIPVEKTSYCWNLEKKEWQPISMYQYTYTNSDKLETLLYTEWNNKNASWDNNSHKVEYLSKTDNDSLIADNNTSNSK